MVFPLISKLPLLLLIHCPSCMALLLSATLRNSNMDSAITSSATERVFENGELKTAIPLLPAAFMSIWFVPIQKAPMAISLSALFRTFAVTFVLERIPST